jgi:hypothetical protein
MVEIFTPSNLASLVSGLRRLKWDTGGFFHGYWDAEQWISQTRQSRFGGASRQLGWIVPEASDFLSTDVLISSLPHGIARAHASLLSLTPSITALVVQFIFDAEMSSSPDRILRTDYASFVTRLPRGHSVHSPELIKKADLHEARDRINSDCKDWFGARFAGVFSGEPEHRFMPAVWFLTFRDAKPFDSNDHNSHLYMRVLGMDSDRDAWDASQLSGLTMSNVTWPQGSDLQAIFLAGLWEEILSDTELEGYGGRTSDGFVNYLSLVMDSFVVTWSLHQLLDGYRVGIAQLRDRATTRVRSLPGQRSSRFQHFRRRLFARSGDVEAVCRDLLELTADKRWFEYDLPDFKRSRHDGHLKTLAEVVRSSVSKEARVVRDDQRQQRELILLDVNLRLQRSVVTLSWMLVILTLGGVAAAIVAVLVALRVG